jgi:TIGR03987 family protein
MLVYAIISITLALIFYTIGVWAERIQGQLKKWHLVIFWLGLIFDTTGTTLMSKIAAHGFVLNFHGITGLLAILLMVFHAVWATIVIVKNNKEARANFHKFSIVVWIIWLIPYISGAIFGMVR